MLAHEHAAARVLTPFAALAIAVAIAVSATGCASGGGGADGGEPVAVAAPDADKGAALFASSCALCHGELGVGTQTGPPLVHRIYEPGHHSDDSFRSAMKNGVVSHHWNFGNMPARPELSDGDIEDIIAYVRAIQREAGIY